MITNSHYQELRVYPLNSLNLDPKASRKIKAYVERMSNGNEIDYRTTFYAVPNDYLKLEVYKSRITGVSGLKPLPREWIYESFVPHILQSLAKYPLLKEFEMSYIKYLKSSRSKQWVWSTLKTKLLESFKLANRQFDDTIDKALSKGARILKKIYRKYIPARSCRPLSIDGAIAEMQQTTSWCAPYFVDGAVYRNNKLIESNLELYKRVALTILDCLRDKRPIPMEYRMYQALVRIQEADMSKDPDNRKNRIVWGDPHGATIIAATTFPFLNKCANIDVRDILRGLAYTNESLAKHIRKDGEFTYLSADQTAFDNHINAGIVRKYINPIILDSFNWDGRDDLKRGVDWYLNYHMWEDPILTPDGVYEGTHGMPSGVLYVNEVDSMYLILISYAMNYIDGNKYFFIVLKVQGDDLVIYVRGHVDIDDLVNTYVSLCLLFGLEANKLKQFVHYSAILFIKRFWCLETPNGYRSKIWSLCGLMNMEHVKSWGEGMYEVRAGAILSNHYITDPGIGEYFTQVMLGFPPYQLGYKLNDGYRELVSLVGGAKDVSSRLNLGSWDNMLASVNQSNNVAILDSSNLSIQKWIDTLKQIPGDLPPSWVWLKVTNYVQSMEGLSKQSRLRARKRMNNSKAGTNS